MEITFLHHGKARSQMVCKLPKHVLTLESPQEILEAAVLLILSTMPQIRDVSEFNTYVKSWGIKLLLHIQSTEGK